jgi:hypothetical protein
LSFPKWQIWKWLGREAAILNVEKAIRQQETQIARAEIIAAKIKASRQNSDHHKFLHSCYVHLDTGLVEPKNIRILIGKYNSGSCPKKCVGELYGLAMARR